LPLVSCLLPFASCLLALAPCCYPALNFMHIITTNRRMGKVHRAARLTVRKHSSRLKVSLCSLLACTLSSSYP
jgi:hypothetical protein